MRRRMIGGQTVSNGIYILHTNMECDVEYKTSPPDEYEYVYP